MMSPTPDLAEAVDRLFEPFAQAGSPGAVVAVTEGGSEIAGGAYGLASVNHAIPLDRRSILRIGSQSKQFTVLLLLMLEAEGRLSMDDPVQDHLPWVPRFAHPITLRHLASNTSGLRDHFEALTFSGRSIFAPSTRQDAREVIARQDALNFVPGTEMIYSNGGFVVLSELVERVCNAPFGEVLKQRITGPLGMNDTRLMAKDSEVGPRLATHYSRAAGGGWRHLTWGVVLGGEGGMVSTLDDMLLWQANLRTPQVGTPGMVDRMTTPTRYANGALSPYGLGLVSDPYRGMRTIGHGGSVAGGRSESMRFPDADLGVVILANTDAVAPFSLARRIADHQLGARLLPVRKPRRSRAAAGGRRVLPRGGRRRRVRDRGPGRRAVPARRRAAACGWSWSGPASSDRRPDRGPGAPADGSPARSTRSGAGRNAVTSVWRAAPPRVPGRFAGRYVQRGLDLRADVTDAVDSLRLAVRSPLGAFRAELPPIDEDLCLLCLTDEADLRPDRPWLATIRFDTDGFVLNSDRTKNLLFAQSDVR
jgi:CubicO group peptidase (beta-lactamase class C family)